MDPDRKRLLERILIWQSVRPLILVYGVGGLIVLGFGLILFLVFAPAISQRQSCGSEVVATVTSSRSVSGGAGRFFQQTVETSDGQRFELQAAGGVLNVGDQVELEPVCNGRGEALLYQNNWRLLAAGAMPD